VIDVTVLLLVDEVPVDWLVDEVPVDWLADDWTPVPERTIAVGELLSSLVIVTLPERAPVAAGANVTFRTALCPVFRSVPADTPVALKPGPETVALEMVIVDWPEFVTVTAKTLLLPTLTLPKFRLDALNVRACPPVVAPTARAVVTPTQPEFMILSNASKQRLR
jgi:hypothetical protein